MSIHRRLVMTAAAVLACAAAGGGLAIAQGGTSGHRGKHSITHLRHHKRALHRHSAARAGGRADRLGRHRHRRAVSLRRHRHHHPIVGHRRGARRCARPGDERGECRGRAVRRALHSCDFDDVSADVVSDASPELREDCAGSESSEATTEVAPTTEAANFAG